MDPRPTSSVPGPLAGIRVADLSTVLAGPYCTMLLADLGADVVKVEPPDGDATRGWGPPFVGAGLDGPDDPGSAAYYFAVNRNKRSIRLDLRHPDGLEVARRLVARSDVLVENFRSGGLARLGLDDAELERLNPGLVHLAITGYGSTGPDAHTPGYDFVVQAVAGLMSITGFPDADGGRPTKVGVAIGDIVTGMLGAIGVLGALSARDRATGPATGRGQRVDVSILESTLAVLINQAQNAFATGVAPGRLGNAHPNIVPYETFATADGEIAIAAGSEKQWRALTELLGLGRLAGDARYATNAERVEHRVELRALLAERFVAASSAEWLARLEGAGVPAGPVNDVLAAIESPQSQARGMDAAVEHPAYGLVRQVGLPISLSATPGAIRTAPPRLGEQTDEILGELDFGAADVEALHRDGVV